jgi:DNA-directed RNA polymerase specialized sigma24 family protein
MTSHDGDVHPGTGRHGDLLDRMYSVAVHLAGDRRRAERAVERAFASTDPDYDGDKRRIALYRALISALRDEPRASAETHTDAPLVDAVHELPEEDRATVLLADIEGFGSRQLARVLDEPAAEARDAVTRSHLRLFDALSAADGGRFRPAGPGAGRRPGGSSRPARPTARDEGRDAR